METAEVSESIFPYLFRKVTERAALESHEWIGSGIGKNGHQAAFGAMSEALNELGVNGTVVIGEGTKDDSSKLFVGDQIGDADGEKQFDIAVDPVEGMTHLAKGQTNAMAAFALAPKGTMFDPSPAFYMEKFAAPPEVRGKINMSWTVEKKLKTVAQLMDKDIENLKVFVLDKPRHRNLIREICETGARVSLYPAGDIAGALIAAIPDSEIDVMMGTGGTSEGVISACAIRAIGGEFQVRLDPQLATELVRVRDAGLDTERWYDRDELVASDDVHFCATGITTGLLFGGVHRSKEHFRTETLIVNGATQERVLLTNWHNR